ncbi:MAG: hypothetical protein HY237_13440 [Acidobacteria bacterium]|nr:hypothetical protein [Acidobacteriota bacterium]
MKNAVNWTLTGIGGLLIVAEVVLGAATRFDLARAGNLKDSLEGRGKRRPTE